MLHEKKKSIVENDVVLIHINEQPAFFSRVEKIIADRKSGWWQISFLLLKIPLNVITWILDNEQIRGAEFTMKGVPIRIEKVVAPVPDQQEEKQIETTEFKEKDDSATILSLHSKKKD